MCITFPSTKFNPPPTIKPKKERKTSLEIPAKTSKNDNKAEDTKVGCFPHINPKEKIFKGFRNIEYFGRVALASCLTLGSKSKINTIHSALEKHKKDKPAMLDHIISTARGYSDKLECETNYENDELKNLSNSKESCIFMMNHDNMFNDPKILAQFIWLLYEQYKIDGNNQDYPLPKIIMNEDIINSQPKKLKEVMKTLGFVGVKAGLFNNKKDKEYNRAIREALCNDFVTNSNNIFIFPEGMLGAVKKMDMDKKFRPGLASYIMTALNKGKERVKVVPLGFALNPKNKNLGSIQIGEPIYFRKAQITDQEGNPKEHILFSPGNLLSDKANSNYIQYFYGKDSLKDVTPEDKIFAEFEEDDAKYKALKINGVPEEDPRKQLLLLSGVLMENLKVCKKQALEKLPEE